MCIGVRSFLTALMKLTGAGERRMTRGENRSKASLSILQESQKSKPSTTDRKHYKYICIYLYIDRIHFLNKTLSTKTVKKIFKVIMCKNVSSTTKNRAQKPDGKILPLEMSFVASLSTPNIDVIMYQHCRVCLSLCRMCNFC